MTRTNTQQKRTGRWIATWGAVALLSPACWPLAASAWNRPHDTASGAIATDQASGRALFTEYTYDAAGRLQSVTDNAGVQTRTAYDALGRAERVIENYVDGVPGGAGEDEDRTT
ncbi:MAG: RHS repeat domain-containing protein, partial [Planctomycetota bacterium]